MLEFCRKHDGSISVFLTLILIPTLIFGGVIVDGVRIYGSKNIISGAGGMALNGALAGYDSSLNDAYGLIAMAETPEEIESRLQDYFESSLSANGLTTDDFSRALIQLQLMEGSFTAEHVEGSEIYETEVMKQEILEYMKYRAPVTLVSRAILDKLDQFAHVEKEKEAVQSQLKFESELEDLQDKMNALLSEVNTLRDVYGSIKSTEEISRQMQETKDNYLKMCRYAIASDRLNNCPEKIEGDTRSLLESYNDTADSCGSGIDGFAQLLKMQQIDNGMEDPYTLLDGLEEDSDEYREISAELSAYEDNAGMWTEQVQKIRQEYAELSADTYSGISDIYEAARKGHTAAVSAQEKLAELRKKLEECSRLYQDWEGDVTALPGGSVYKDPMQKEVDQEIYKSLFAENGADEFSQKLGENEAYYEKVCTELEELAFNGAQAVFTEGKSAIDPIAMQASGQVTTKQDLAETAKSIFGNYTGDYKLDTGGKEKVSLEGTDFVQFLRQMADEELNKGNSGQMKESVNKWNGDLEETLKEYKTLFLSDDIEALNIRELGGGELPSIWLSARELQEAGEEAQLSGSMSDKDDRKEISDSAVGAMNTNNASLSLFASIGDLLMDAAENIYITEYVMGMLSYYTVNRDAAGKEVGDPLSLSNCSLKENAVYRAEVEYAVWGSDNSRDNVTKTKALIYAIQFVSNAIFAFTDKTLTSDARTIALAFPGGALIKTAVKAALLSVVTIIETTKDLNMLVKGEAVPFSKWQGGWKTPLLSPRDSREGALKMRYEDYLWILVFINSFSNQKSLLARTADCIELNQTKSGSDPDRSMKFEYTMLKVSADVHTETFFLRKVAAEQGAPFDENAFVIHYNGIQGY